MQKRLRGAYVSKVEQITRAIEFVAPASGRLAAGATTKVEQINKVRVIEYVTYAPLRAADLDPCTFFLQRERRTGVALTPTAGHGLNKFLLDHVGYF